MKPSALLLALLGTLCTLAVAKYPERLEEGPRYFPADKLPASNNPEKQAHAQLSQRKHSMLLGVTSTPDPQRFDLPLELDGCIPEEY